MAQDRKIVEITAKFLDHKGDAIKIEDADLNDVWLPKSQVDFEGAWDDVEPGETIDFEIPVWLATNKGLI